MKTHPYRIAAIFWMSLGPILAGLLLCRHRYLWDNLPAIAYPVTHLAPPTPSYWQGMLGPLYLFAIAASIFLFRRDTQWAHISVAIIACFTAILGLQWHSAYDGIIGIIALATFVLLLLPRRQQVAN